jgi:uncharacterized protein with von Willebrand factor type A (vWA) domain
MESDPFVRTHADLVDRMLAFATLLRTQYAIPAGHAQAYEALRALEAIGIDDELRVRAALRSVFCSKHDELERFDRAFDAFFANAAHGVPQPRLARPHGYEPVQHAAPARRREPAPEKTRTQAQYALQARYSPAAAQSHDAPTIAAAGLAEALTDAGRLIAALRLGRSRRWKPHTRGKRFDLRRTLRASLQSGGDPVHIRTLGHPLRNPRIVLFLDASRSMADHAPDLLHFAYALCQRSHRTSVFIFSTALREITRDLRNPLHEGTRTLEALGEAWGGGTRIGACLQEFLQTRGGGLDADTLVIVASDGLDVGEVAQLERAMRNIARRCAGIMWLNPHAGDRRFTPAARGMQAALPYIFALLDARDLQSLSSAARHIRR